MFQYVLIWYYTLSITIIEINNPLEYYVVVFIIEYVNIFRIMYLPILNKKNFTLKQYILKDVDNHHHGE